MRAVSLLGKSTKKQQSLCLFIRMLQLRATTDLHRVLIVSFYVGFMLTIKSLLQEGMKRDRAYQSK